MRDELLNERRNRFYASYMDNARKKMKININNETLAQVLISGKLTERTRWA